jgi:hypothetical protein
MSMHLNKHFLFVIGAPALLVLLVAGAGIYRLNTVDEKTPEIAPAEHIVHGEGMAPQDVSSRILAPHADTVATVPPQGTTTDAAVGTHFTGTLQKVDTGCFADGECFVVVDGKHVTAVRGWSQEIVGTVQGVEGFGDLTKHIGEQMDVYAYGAGDGVYTLYGNEALYIRIATSTHVSNAYERPQVQ